LRVAKLQPCTRCTRSQRRVIFVSRFHSSQQQSIVLLLDCSISLREVQAYTMT
jgi:hypothetical protein